MELALVGAAFALVLGPFAIAIFVSELGKVRENRKLAQQAHSRIDRLVEDKMSPEEQEALRQERLRQAEQDEQNRSFYEYGGC